MPESAAKVRMWKAAAERSVMVGFECLWCGQQVTIHPEALAAGAITCPACQTQVDLAVGPAAAIQPLPRTGARTELPLAA